MNYQTLQSLNTILSNIEKDTAAIGGTIAILMVVIYTILIMFDQDTSAAAHTKRWENLRKVLFCAAIIAASGTLITFSQQLGGNLHS